MQQPSDLPSDPRELRRHTRVTDAEHERLREDRRQDEAQKSFHTVIEQEIQQAREDLERPAAALLLS